jgi:SagB-type dehydrogenase family enzyme
MVGHLQLDILYIVIYTNDVDLNILCDNRYPKTFADFFLDAFHRTEPLRTPTLSRDPCGGDPVSEKHIGERFQQQTKYTRGGLGEGPDWSIQPDLYKSYPDALHVALPQPDSLPSCSFDETVKKRKSIRRFSTKAMDLEQLSYLLWVSTGIQRVEEELAFRTAPSAGALYPIETYLVVHRVEQLDPGVYHYDILHHRLAQLKKGDYRGSIVQASLDQSMCASAAVVFVWTGVFNRSKCKYGQRAYRYIYLDAGHIAENLALGAVSLGLGSCQIAALYDDEVNSIIGVDGKKESVLYLSAVGASEY